eukprot:Opistho-2@67339
MSIRVAFRRLAEALPFSFRIPLRASTPYVSPIVAVRLMHPSTTGHPETRHPNPMLPNDYARTMPHASASATREKENGPNPGDSQDGQQAAIDEFKGKQRKSADDKREGEIKATEAVARAIATYQSSPNELAAEPAALNMWRELSEKGVNLPGGTALSAIEIWELIKDRDDGPPEGVGTVFRGMLAQRDFENVKKKSLRVQGHV